MKLVIWLSILLLFMGCNAKMTSIDKRVKRVALVIGNQDYGENSLRNPISDARGIKKTLEGIGFDVMLREDITLSEFYKALDALKKKIEPDNTIVFFYFAGHGNTLNQRSSEEYLMMTDKKRKVLVSIYRLYEFLNIAKARHNIVVIDACRDYQQNYIRTNRVDNGTYITASRNLRGDFRASISNAKGELIDEFIIHDDDCSDSFPRSTIVSYATMHNQEAKDWSLYDYNHSPYTRQLIMNLDIEEIPIEEVFRRVRAGLIRETGGSQINLEENSLEKNIWLVPQKGQVAFAPPI